MVIIKKTTLSDYAAKYSNSTEALNHWYDIVRKQSWKSFSDIKQTFNSADAAGNDRYVFNINGNNYRLVTMIHFHKRTIYIRFVGTNSEYDKIDCSTI